MGAAFRAREFRRSASLFIGSAKGSKTDNLDGSPPGCAARQRSRTVRHMHGENHDAEIRKDNHRFALLARSEARLLRGACHRAGQRPDPLARNDVDISADAVIARRAQRDEAIFATRVDSTPRVGVCVVLAKRTRGFVLY